MDTNGLLMIALGIGVLLCLRDFVAVTRELQPWLFRTNYPRISRRYATLPNRWGVLSTRMAIAMGWIVGVGAIVGGAIIAFG